MLNPKIFVDRTKIDAIVVTYYPHSNIYDNLKAVSEQVEHLIVVDNGSDITEVNLLIKISEELKNLSLILNHRNIGLAKALNIGIKASIEKGSLWVLTLDQDSLVTANFVSSMINAYENCPYKPQVMSVGPTYISSSEIEALNGVTRKIYSQSEKLEEHPLYSKCKTVITSGNLVNISVFNKVGFFNESYFIDYIDLEFCLRLSRFGYKIIQSNKSILFHKIGIPTQHIFMGKIFITSNHSNIRRYYLLRNSILTYRKYLLNEPVWVCKNSIFILRYSIKMVLFETNRKEKLKSSLLGAFHGLLGITGECNIKSYLD
jgi:rhamnosyltransferase